VPLVCKETPMMDKVQMEMAKTLWEQSRAAARQAQDAWAMVLKSQQTLLNSMRPAGAPFAMAADQFEKLVQFQAEQQQAAAAFVEKVSADYAKLLEQQKK